MQTIILQLYSEEIKHHVQFALENYIEKIEINHAGHSQTWVDLISKDLQNVLKQIQKQDG